MNESMILRFIDYTPEKAEWLLACARKSIAPLHDRFGFRNGILYVRPDFRCMVYMTENRTIVAREISHDGTDE